MRQIISYLRVSTDKQGQSGLGIEAQRDAIARFAVAEGCEVLAEFVEVETGKGSDALDRRPKLAEALAKARKVKAAVVVAKLCRLSRDVAFISGLIGAAGAVHRRRAGGGRRPVHAAHLPRVGRERAGPDFRADPRCVGTKESAGGGPRQPDQSRRGAGEGPRGESGSRGRLRGFAANVLPIVRQIEAGGG